jgi:hypothetical protein
LKNTRAYCLILVLLLSSPSAKSWNWLSATWTPCEGVGMSGSARYFAEAQISLSNGQAILEHLRVYGSSASFDAREITLSASVSMFDKQSKAETRPVDLSRPEGKAYEADPGPNDTRSLYLPGNVKITIPSKSVVRIRVTAIKSECHINSSTHDENILELP